MPRMDGPRLRFATEDDAAAVLEIYAPIVRDTPISFELEPPDEAEMARRIRVTGARFPWIVAESDGAVVGYAYATTFRAREAYDWTVESTVYVHESHRGHGVARLLMSGLVDALRTLGYRGVVAGIALPNDASVRLHESLGFVASGAIPRAGRKHGAWHDMAFWTLELADVDGTRRPLAPGDVELPF